MSFEIFLIAPMNAETATFPALLADTLAAAPVAALLLPLAGRSEAEYCAFVEAVRPAAQDGGTAVLLENAPHLVRKLNVDGVHMTGGGKEFLDAAKDLRPDYIVGAGNLHSHHEAMLRGENADYILFGQLGGALNDNARADAIWWSETFEVPAVFADPTATAETATSEGCEFVGLSDTIWQAKDGPAKALKAIAEKLGSTA